MAELRAICPDPIGHNVVEILEDMLAKARSGEISSAVVVYVQRGDGVTGWIGTDFPSHAKMVGALRATEYELLKRWLG